MKTESELIIASLTEKLEFIGEELLSRLSEHNKELRETFLKENKFEAKATPAITALLSGDAQALKEYDAAKAGIGSLEAKDDKKNIAAFEETVKKFVESIRLVVSCFHLLMETRATSTRLKDTI